MHVLWSRLGSAVTSSALINPVNFNQSFFIQNRFCSIIMQLREKYLKAQAKPKPPNTHPLNSKPYAKGIVLRTLIKKPRKPNSANRKCVLVKLSNGQQKIAFVPGEGHNLQEHQVVLVEPKRLKDVPGVKLRCVRGKYDLPHVKKEKIA